LKSPKTSEPSKLNPFFIANNNNNNNNDEDATSDTNIPPEQSKTEDKIEKTQLEHDSNDELSELFETFSLLDKNFNGSVSSKEMNVVMKSLNLVPTDYEIKDMIAEAETNGDDTIDFPEFISFLARRTTLPKSESEWDKLDLREAFNIFKNKNSDFIDAKGMKHVLKSINEVVPSDLESLLKEADTDGDGKMSFDGELININ
jgi:calmodulin